MRERIKQVMAGSFQVPLEEIPGDASINEFPKWDSLAHMELMLALELELGVRISASAMLDLLSLDAIEDYLLGQELSNTR